MKLGILALSPVASGIKAKLLKIKNGLFFRPCIDMVQRFAKPGGSPIQHGYTNILINCSRIVRPSVTSDGNLERCLYHLTALLYRAYFSLCRPDMAKPVECYKSTIPLFISS